MAKQNLRYTHEHSLAYAQYGNPEGFPVLIQHGMIASIYDDQIFSRLIEAGARLVCIARPGYGESTPKVMKDLAEWGRIVSALVDELELAQFDVLGISSGAPYSYAIGYALPGKVRSLFILSGTPALYDPNVAARWPYPLKQDASIEEMQELAYDLFFNGLSKEDLERNEIRDSMANHGFGIAQDFRLRCMDWGFQLSEVKTRVLMRHSRADDSVPFVMAEMTARLLPNCRFDARDHDPHFSPDVLDDFITTCMAGFYQPQV